MCSVRIRKAGPIDMDAVVRVQREAFRRVADELGLAPTDLPPLAETPEQLTALYEQGTVFFVAEDAGSIVGSVRATPRAECVEIGRLVVADGHVRQGVGTSLMDVCEAAFPPGTRFELFTGTQAHGPRALYAKRGYRFLRVDSEGPVELVWLEKRS